MAGAAPEVVGATSMSLPRGFDPLDPAFVADPYPFFRRLREEEPVHRSVMGAWVLTRHADVSAALGDDRLGNAPARYAVVNARNRERYVCADVAAHILPFLDPPEHTAPRLLIARRFHERLRRSPPDFVGIAADLLADWEGHEVRDVVADFASPLAVSVIASVLGVPLRDVRELERLSESFFYLFAAIPSREVREQLDTALTDFRSHLREVIRDRRANPADDLVSDLLSVHGEGPLTEAQLVDNCMLLFADGVENVDRAIGNAVHTLLTHPDQFQLLRERPDLVPSAVEECLRFESPGQYIGRIAKADIELHGVTIPESSMVLLALGSANRDPDVFEHPDVFDISRRTSGHLAFGRGRHSCVGGALVALEMGAALVALMQETSELRLATDAVRFVPRPGHRWVERLPVRWRASRPRRHAG